MKKFIIILLAFGIAQYVFSVECKCIKNYTAQEIYSPTDSSASKKKRKRNKIVVARFTVKYKPADSTPFYTIDPWWLWSLPKYRIWQSGSDPIISTNLNQETPFLVGNQLYGGPSRRVDPILIYWKTSQQFTNFWE